MKVRVISCVVPRVALTIPSGEMLQLYNGSIGPLRGVSGGVIGECVPLCFVFKLYPTKAETAAIKTIAKTPTTKTFFLIFYHHQVDCSQKP